MEEENLYCHKGHKMIKVMTSPPSEDEKCYACPKSFSRSKKIVYYACIDCDKKCAGLPKQLSLPIHQEHLLVLLAKPPYYQSEACKCQVCKNSCNNLVYHCSSCVFEIDILCAFRVYEDITIPTHHHSVRLIQRPTEFECDACGVDRRCSESYICTKPSCGFWIHKECRWSPETLRYPSHGHEHPLMLAISVPIRYLRYKFACEICHDNFGSNIWIYYCQRCKYFIHLKCILDKRGFYNDDARKFFLSYPRPGSEMIRQLKTIVYLSESYSPRAQVLAEMKVDSHKHSLVLSSSVFNQLGEDEITCDACIESISSSCYKCGQQDCNYFLHNTCAALPKHISGGWGKTVKSELYILESPWDVVKCSACNSFSNGYSYKCTANDRTFPLDIKCLMFYLSGDIVHTGHACSLLLDKNVNLEELTCSYCGSSIMGQCFRCTTCKFVLGYECATLPATMKHRWDKHPLVLCFPPHIRDTDQGEEFYCEVCEDEIHPKHCMYRCAECDHSFHPRCIPTLGESRNIKFGKTVSIESHPHKLTLVPQAKLTSRCHSCRKSLYWSKAFECAYCGFYLCHDCMPKQDIVVDILLE